MIRLFVFALSMLLLSSCHRKINSSVKIAESLSAEQSAVLSSVNTFFDGMRQNNGDMAISVWADNATGYSIMTKADGQTKIKTDNPMTDLSNIKNWLDNSTARFNEEIFDVEIRVDGGMAVVWAPYNFYRNDELLHSGVNAFTMIKIDNLWKIISITDTRYVGVERMPFEDK